MRTTGLLLGLALWVSGAVAVNYVFDEFLFSKDTWHLWKLDNPLADFNPSDLLPKAKEQYPGYELSEFNSLDGTMNRLPPSARPASTGLASDIEAIDDDHMLDHAAKAAQCTTCHVLVSVAWARLTGDVLSGEAVTPQLVRAHLEDACEKDALDTVLKKYTILKMESDGGSGALTFFVVRERRGGSKAASATDAEEAAVTMSCKTLVHESGKDLVGVLLDQLANYRREALRLLAKYGRDGGNEQDELPAGDGSGAAASGSGSSGRLPRLDGAASTGGGAAKGAAGDDDDEYVDPDDLDDEGDLIVKGKGEGKGQEGKVETAAKGGQAAKEGAAAAKSTGGAAANKAGKAAGPRTVRGLLIKANPGEPECLDLNVKCPDWAASGECEVNPNYMIGTAGHRGHCRKACGMCQPADLLAVAPALAAELETLSSALLLAAKNLGCGASGACLTGVSGMAFGPGLVKQQLLAGQAQGGGGGSGGTAAGGFVLGKPWWGVPEVRMVPVAQRKAVPGEDGAPPAKAGESAVAADSGGGGGTSQPPSHAEVDRVLAPALAHRLLSIPSDFFIYEYLYKNHTRHFHPDAEGKVTEDWLLGKFTRESLTLISSVTGEVAGLEELDLLPGGSHTERLKAHTWPYVKQVYAGGDECVLGGGRRVVRRVESRIACSPDAGTYMLIREPDFCTYVFVIYVPQLCSLEYYKPRPKTTATGAGAASGGGVGGAGGGKRVRGRG